MSQTPTKLDMLLKINEIIESHNSVTSRFVELLQKLDADTGVSDTDYTDLEPIEPFNTDGLAAAGQLINMRE